ncbi:MAG: sulfate ABC transporter permease, partial [Vulcanimicrobiaceae bacterium]
MHNDLPGPTDDPVAMRATCFIVTAVFVVVFLVFPLITVSAYALRSGLGAALASIATVDAWSAISLTLTVAVVSVPLNMLFGICAAWAIAKYDFRGKTFLMSLIDLPFSVSPVLAGLAFMLIFGLQGWLGPTLRDWNIQVVFALPGMVLATLFVSLPFVARELIPLMTDQGRDEEAAAISLGATGFQTFFRVTLPNIKWGLLYG